MRAVGSIGRMLTPSTRIVAVLALTAGLTACATHPYVADEARAAQPSPPPTRGTTDLGAPPTHPADRHASPGTGHAVSAGRPLSGMTIVLDPGHNLNNQYHTASINRLVDVGTGRKACDTTGTATNHGYPEATYTLDVSRRARTLLTALGATVKLTYDGDRSYGPCVDERAAIGNKAHADAAISVHADGAASGDRGFHVILPASVHAGIADTRKIATTSKRLGTDVRNRFTHDTGMPYSNYVGHGTALDVRSDLGGLNLSKVPKVFIECGNMRNATDAGLLSDAAWRQRAARGIADGIAAYLEGATS